MATKFVIVGSNDNPLYEADFTGGAAAAAAASTSAARETPHYGQFVVHAALDCVDEAKWRTRDMFLRRVDGAGRHHLLAWVTATNATFVLLTERPDLEPARGFFAEVYELFLRAMLNPFYALGTPIASPHFDARVRKLAQRYLSAV